MLRAKRRRMHRTNRASMGFITLAGLLLFGVLTYKTVALDKQTSQYQTTIDGYKKDIKKLGRICLDTQRAFPSKSSIHRN